MGYERGNEHLSDLEKKRTGKPLWEHMKEEHEGKVDRYWYKMTMVKKHDTALQRQIREALDIEGSRADVVLNEKGEWNGSRIPHLRVEVGNTIEEEENENRDGTRRGSIP